MGLGIRCQQMSQKGVPEMSSVTTIAGMFSKKAVVAWALIAGLLLAVALLPKASATENAVVGVEASKSVVPSIPVQRPPF